MTVLDPYVRHLAETAERLAAQPPRRPFARRMPPGRMAALLAAATLLAGGAAAAATDLWQPPLGDDRRGHPTASASSPAAVQLEHFGVLRRDPTNADRSDAVRYALSMLSPRGVQGVRTDHVRHVGARDVLVPAASADGKRDVLCLFVRDPKDGGGVICNTTDEILSGRAVLMMISPPAAPPAPRQRPAEPAVELPANASPAERRRLTAELRRLRPTRTGRLTTIAPPSGPATLIGVVPDGVARVRQGDASVDVDDNVFHLTLRREAQPAVEWLDDDDDVVRHVGG